MQWWQAVVSMIGSRTREGETLAPSEGKEQPPAARSSPALQVLIADDSQDSLRDTACLLSRWEIAHTTVSNGAEALALAGERHFDMILMDIDMPVMDGLESTQRIRQLEMDHPERLRTPIVAYTSGRLLLADTRSRARMGFDEVIGKPGNVQQMEACLRRWCSAHPLRPSSRAESASLQTRA